MAIKVPAVAAATGAPERHGPDQASWATRTPIAIRLSSSQGGWGLGVGAVMTQPAHVFQGCDQGSVYTPGGRGSERDQDRLPSPWDGGREKKQGSELSPPCQGAAPGLACSHRLSGVVRLILPWLSGTPQSWEHWEPLFQGRMPSPRETRREWHSQCSVRACVSTNEPENRNSPYLI